jgi:hypothetical protein
VKHLIAAALMAAVSISACRAADTDGTLPDPKLTPGAVRTTDRVEICNTRTKTIRNVPDSVKQKVYRIYGLTSKRDKWCNSEEGCETDHLVPIGLGGSNEPIDPRDNTRGDTRNLWPQQYSGLWNAHHKDQLEVRLMKLVCKQGLDVETAQKAISTNWIEAYKKYVSPVPKNYSKYPVRQD